MTDNIHPTALVECKTIGPGTRIWAWVHVMRDARIGSHCNLGDRVFIESGAGLSDNVTIKNNVGVWDGLTLEDEVFVGPSVAFTNDLYPRSPRMAGMSEHYADKVNWLTPTIVERGCSIGASAVIVAGVRLGRYSMIAAGATVTRDVEPYALMVGAPARRVGYVCRCGQPRSSADQAQSCTSCGATAHSAPVVQSV